jgi:hypothetical protein
MAETPPRLAAAASSRAAFMKALRRKRRVRFRECEEPWRWS